MTQPLTKSVVVEQLREIIGDGNFTVIGVEDCKGLKQPYVFVEYAEPPSLGLEMEGPYSRVREILDYCITTHPQ
jgi:hypothetical protein